jgi:uncharacterized membrane protein
MADVEMPGDEEVSDGSPNGFHKPHSVIPEQDNENTHPQPATPPVKEAPVDAKKMLSTVNKLVWATVIVVWVGFFIWLQMLPGMAKAQQNAETAAGCIPQNISVNSPLLLNAPHCTIVQYNGIWLTIGKSLNPYGAQLKWVEYGMAILVIIMFILLIVKKAKGKKGGGKNKASEPPKGEKGGSGALPHWR